jgi:hypothetical protein
LPSDPTEGVRHFDTSEHETYTEEEPNALTTEEVAQFLAGMREMYPQHYAMTYLGLATGLRPSSLRPLRRCGATPDVLWDKSVVLVRRSHTLGDEVMETTKTKRRQRINVPAEVMEVLRWHVATQLHTAEQQESDLLFPADDGRFRSSSVLKKPFEAVAEWIGLTKSFTARGLRRTFNDLAREAQVESLVTKSISGHMTDRMKDHYSTVRPTEQRESIGRVLRLVHTADGASREGEAPSSGVLSSREDAHPPTGGAHGPGGGAHAPGEEVRTVDGGDSTASTGSALPALAGRVGERAVFRDPIGSLRTKLAQTAGVEGQKAPNACRASEEPSSSPRRPSRRRGCA